MSSSTDDGVGTIEMTESEPGDSEKVTSLSFKVDSDFKKEFKGFAVARGISMTDLLKEGFALSKKNGRR